LPSAITAAAAAAVHFTAVVKGQYQVKPPLPFIPGNEVSGIVVQLGAAVKGFKLGDLVCMWWCLVALLDMLLLIVSMTYILPCKLLHVLPVG
jgi:NADPH:quinone reductase-like Zn-dependent oxidoreductase